MLPEREIEEKLKASFAATFTGDIVPRIVGAWDVADDGDVKGRGDASAAVFAVTVGLRAYDSFCSPQCDLPCAAVLTVRREACPTGAELAELIEPLMALIHVWNEDNDSVYEDLATSSFFPGGFRLTGGNLEQSEESWTVSIDFTLRGVINTLATETTTEET